MTDRNAETRQRKPVLEALSKSQQNELTGKDSGHPAGPVKHGTAVETLRIVLFGIYFFGSCLL